MARLLGMSLAAPVLARLRSVVGAAGERSRSRGGRNFDSCELLSKETICQTRGEPVRRFTFKTPPGTVMDVNTALRQVVVVQACGKLRMYSPTSEQGRPDGTFDLIVRVYRKGLVSRWLDGVGIGDRVPMIWPWPAPLPADRHNPGKRVGLVAFGIGVTELYCVAASELRDPAVKEVVLLYATRDREEQKVLEPELRELLARYPDRFRLERTLTREEAQGFRSGRVSAEMMREVFPWAQGERGDVRFLPSGTRDMIDQAWEMLEGLGYARKEHTLIRDASAGGLFARMFL